MTKNLKRVLLGLCMFGVMIVLTLTSAGFILETDTIKKLMLRKINDSFPAVITYESASVSLFTGHVELKNIRLADQHDDTLIEVEGFELDITLSALLKKELLLNVVKIQSPKTWISMNESGHLNILDAFKTSVSEENDSSSSLPVNILINTLSLKNGYVSFHKKNREGTDLLEGNDISLTIRNGNIETQSAEFQMGIRSIKYDFGNMIDEIRDFQFETTIKKDNASDLSIALTSDPLSININGDISSLLTNPEFNAKLLISASLDELGDVSRLNQPVSGHLDINLSVQGTLQNPEAELTLMYGGGELYGIPVNEAELNFSLMDSILDINKVFADFYSQRIHAIGSIDLGKAFPSGLTGTPVFPDEIQYNINVQQEIPEINKIPGNKLAVSGGINSTLKLEGKGVTPDKAYAKAELNVKAEDLRIKQNESPIQISLDTSAELMDGQIKVSDLNLKSDHIDATANLEHTLFTDEIIADLKLESGDIEVLLNMFDITGIKGSIALESTISESIKNPNISILLMGGNLSVPGTKIGNLSLEGALTPKGDVNFSEIKIENQGSIILTTGNIALFEENLKIRNVPESDISITLTDIEPHDFTDFNDLKGVLNGSVKLTGNLYHPDVDLRMKGSALQIKKEKIGDLEADLNYTKGIVNINTIKITNKHSGLELKGNAEIFDPGEGVLIQNPVIDISVLGETLLLEDFFQDLHGTLSLSGRFAGNAKNPKGHLSITGSQLDLGIQKIDSILIESDIREHQINLETLKIILTQGQEISADGWISPLSETYSLNLISRGIHLKNIDALSQLDFSNGDIYFNFKGEGKFNNPGFEGNLGIKNLVINSNSMEDTQYSIDLKDHKVSLMGKNWFEMEAIFDLIEKDYSAYLNFDNTDLTPWFNLTGRKDLSGEISGGIRIVGQVDDINQLQISSDLNNLNILMDDQELIHTDNLNMEYMKGSLHIPGIEISILEKGHIILKGSFDRDESVQLFIDGNIPLEAANVLTEIDDMRGDIRLSAEITGNARKPDINGEIKLDKLGLTLPVLEQDLKELSGHIKISSSRIELNQIKGLIDKGSFTINGPINLDHYKPTDFSITANASNLTIEAPDQLSMILNSDIRIVGTPEKSAVTGMITLLEGLYYKDVEFNLLKSVTEKEIEQFPERGKRENPYLKNMELDITVNRRKPFQIDNNLAIMDLSPNLHIGGTAAAPVISGQARVDTGIIMFRDNDFEIKKGIIDFLNPYKIEPTVDIASETEVREWVINMDVSGTPDDLTFTLSSIPKEEHEDILSLIIFGKTAKEFREGDGGGSFSTTKMLTNLAAEMFSDDVQNATGLDTLKVEYSDKDNEESINVTLGKNLSRRMAIKYSVETRNSELTQRVITEYKFLETLLFNAYQDTKGNYGGELQFKLEFR